MAQDLFLDYTRKWIDLRSNLKLSWSTWLQIPALDVKNTIHFCRIQIASKTKRNFIEIP